MDAKRKIKEIKIELPEELHSTLEELARREGWGSVHELVLSIIANYAKRDREIKGEDSTEKMRVKLERYIQDELNKRLAGVETLRRQISELYDELDSIKHRLEAIESSTKGRATDRPQQRPSGKSAIERLKDEKVLFESKLPATIQRDRLFSYFERTGAVVLKLSRERIAVDQEFWEEFKDKLTSEVSSNKEEEITQVLGQRGYALWKALYNDNFIIFDPKTKKWRFIHSEMP
ncbi:MAG: CopG family transcriptional regulator [Desulfurococcaceae archaeon]